MCELHFAVPMSGAVLCALNSRLDAAMASVLLRHSEAKVIFVDAALLGVAQEALHLVSAAGARAPVAVLITELLEDDDSSPSSGASTIEHGYEALVSRGGSPGFVVRWLADENEPIALNYTSGTTSWPKGVIYTHRGAYLNSLAVVLLNGMAATPMCLWTVPMFAHPAVAEATVVGRPDDHWGETPCTFVVVRRKVEADEVMEFCRGLHSWKKARAMGSLSSTASHPQGKVARSTSKL